MQPVIAITGHRPNKLGNDYDLTSPLIKSIETRIINAITLHTPERLITGMALGIDTLFAKIAIELNIPFTAAIPCLNHDSKWPDKSRRIYHDILASKLCTIKLVSNVPYNSKVMQVRNEWMIDNCNLLIAVWDLSEGGTRNCVMYAKHKVKEIYHIDPKSLIIKTD